MKKLNSDVIEMGQMALGAIHNAAEALGNKDVDLANQVIENDDAIDSKYLNIEARALGLIATQQPVAKDLRLIVTILRIINEIERAGDLALNIAKITKREIDLIGIEPVTEIIVNLGNLTEKLFEAAIEAFSKKDMNLAKSLDGMDDKVDDLYKKLIKELFKLEEESSLELALNMMMAGRYFERISDHAVNIAERVKYIITGKLEPIEHNTMEITPR